MRNRLGSWLRAVPGRDELERRHAGLLQLGLIALAGVFALGAYSNVLRSLSVPDAPSPVANAIAMVVSLGLVGLLRRGLFRIVAVVAVALLTVALCLALAGSTPVLGGTYLALLMVPIVMAGLVLGRRALLITSAAVIAGAILAARAQPPAVGPPLVDAMGNFLYAAILITAVVYAFGGSLRNSLVRVIAHERELEIARRELEDAITRLRTETEERERLEDQLAQSQRLESIGRLAGGVAHDFNNLLTAIMGYAALLEEDQGPGGSSPEVAGIRSAADQAAALTRQLLAFSRNQELRFDVVNLSSIVVGVEPLLRRLIGERIALVTRPADDLWPVLADRSQLESVIVNLAVNARDAMADGGTLTIETSNVELDETYQRTHAEVTPGPYAMIAVSDTGVGMDTETMSHIFEPFFTTKALGKGTGLGLATVYGTIRQSRGHIWVYSEPETGTSFKVYLPRTDQAAEADEPPVAARSAHRSHNETVLLAEDEAIVRDFLVIAIERAGYRVVAVDSAEAALEHLARPDAAISVIVSDVVMPGRSGPELLDEVWRTRPGLPAIFMSGYTAAAMEQRPIPEGVALLEKPFTSEQLQAAIEAAIGRGKAG